MRIAWLHKSVVFLVVLLLASLAASATPTPGEGSAKLLPAEIRSFKAIGTPRTALAGDAKNAINLESVEQGEYRSDKNARVLVTIIKTKSDSSAYSTFLSAARALSGDIKIGGVVGTRSLELPNELRFFKGSSYVSVKSLRRTNQAELIELGRKLAEGLDNGEGDIPVLIKHLPDWQTVESQVSYALDLEHLKTSITSQPVLETVSFDGGAEAVTAPYGSAQMTLVEFTTPQLATENDQRILAKIQELRSQGQPVPTVYRRVGNYSVFVFNAASESVANQLIDQVKYEQVVQWLGDNPNWLKQAQKEYTETTLGVLVTVVKTSGLAAMLCFGIGGFLGAVMFARRRAQQLNADAYSDAGGMMRLNLDEMTGQTDPSKLIGPGMSDKLKLVDDEGQKIQIEPQITQISQIL